MSLALTSIMAPTLKLFVKLVPCPCTLHINCTVPLQYCGCYWISCCLKPYSAAVYAVVHCNCCLQYIKVIGLGQNIFVLAQSLSEC